MDLVNLRFVADTGDLDKAEKQLDAVGKKTTEVTKQATKDTKGLTDSLGKFSEIPGPIGEVASKLVGIGDTAKAAFTAITSTVGGLTGVTATTSTAAGTTTAFTGALGASAAATATQTGASGALAIANSAVAASTIEAADAQRKWKDDINSLARQVYGLGRAAGLSADEARKLRNSVSQVYDRAAANSGVKDELLGIGKAAETSTGLVTKLGLAIRGLAAAGPALAAFGLLAGAGGIAAALNFAGTLDDIGDLAAKMGVTSTQAQLIKQEMEDAGVSVDAYATAVQRASVALSRAGEDGKAASEALAALGIATEETNTPTELLTTLTEKYSSKLQEGSVAANELAALQAVLGKNYRETLIAVGAYATAQQRANEFQAAGIGISTAGTAATGEFQNANKDLSFILGVVGSQLVAEVVPAFTGLINALVDSYKNGGLVKVAFDGIRVATQVLMVPIRGLFNIFIQLDAAVQSVGKSIGALFAAIATKSTNPFKELGNDLAKLWETANSRTTAPWSWDTSAPAAPQTMTVTPPTPTRVEGPKTTPTPLQLGKDADGAFKEYMTLLSEQAERDLRALETYDAAEQAAEAEYQSLMKRIQGYKDLVDPMASYKKELAQLNADLATGVMTSADFISAQANIEDRMKKAAQAALEQSDSFKFMERVGQSAFKGIEDTIVDLTMNGKTSFKDMVRSMLGDLTRLFVQLTVIKPLMDGLKASMGGGFGIGSLFSLFLKDGAVMDKGIQMYAKGDVFNKPTAFNHAGGLGVLGEAGPEAVMPLRRGPNGQLGVQASGSGSQGNTYFTFGDIVVQGGATNEETAGEMQKTLIKTIEQVSRGVIIKEKRYGGVLA